MGTWVEGHAWASRADARPAAVERRALLDRLSTATTVLLEAPGGYGKSTLCAQLADHLDVPCAWAELQAPAEISGLISSLAAACRRAGRADLVDAFDPEEAASNPAGIANRLAAGAPILLVVDEVQRAPVETAGWLAAFAEQLPAHVRLAVAGRRVGRELARMAGRPGVVALAAADLRFDADEVRALLGDGTDADVAAVVAATDGWPAAVAVVAARPAAAPVARDLGGAGPAVLQALVGRLLASTDERTRGIARAAAALPLLSAAVLAHVGGEGALDRLLDAGLPIRFRADGWGELPDPVRDLLSARDVDREPLSLEQRRAVATAYGAAGDLAAAVALLSSTGDHEGVCALLGTQRRDAFDRCGLVLLDAAVAAVPDGVLAAHAPVVVELVRATERHPRVRSDLLARGRRLVDSRSEAGRSLAAEQALDDARSGDLAGASAAADAVLLDAGTPETATRGRAHLARALCLLLQDTAGSAAVVADELDRAAALFHLARERSWEAFAHEALGYGCHFTRGAFALAAERLDRALALSPSPDGPRAVALTDLAEILIHAARLDDADVALREARAIAARLGDTRAIAYAAWSGAELACQRRDREAARAALDEVERNPEGWFDRLAGIDFLAHAAEIHTILGDEPEARRALERAEARAAGTSREGAPAHARARYEATFGDAAAALPLLDALETNPIAYPRDRWLRLLLRAVATARLGDATGAALLVERSARAAADIGDPDRAARREPELVAIATPGSPVPPEAHAAVVVLLGRFAVVRGSVDASPPPGHASALVKLLALRRTITVDEAVDLLWEDADLATGRTRLRNVLARVRASSGPIVTRAEGALSLAADVRVDIDRFERDAAAALGAPPAERAGRARRALAGHTGELLPADRYAEWTTAPRERVRRLHLALVDVVADAAIDAGDLDEATRLLDAAIGDDPLEEARYVRLGRALLTQGRPRRARRVADQGLAVAADLGVEPGPELRVLLADLSAWATVRT